MSDDPHGEPTQRTEKGLEIPVPAREDVFAAFKKAATTPDREQPPKRSQPDKN